MTMRPITFIASALVLAACSPVVRPDGGTGLLPVGAPAPEVVGRDVNGTESRLTVLKGTPVVVFFYPKDGSPGCTKEVCGFRGAWAEFQQAGIAVIGVSSDSAASHQRWLKDEHLQFLLSSDESGATARSFGVPSTLGIESRVTFLVGPDGRVARNWPSVDPAIHYKDVLAAARELAKH